MAKLLKKYGEAAWNKFVKHINCGDVENLQRALRQDWVASPNKFIVESEDWALPLWISDRPPSKFLTVSDKEWRQYGSWDNIFSEYGENTSLGRIEKLHTMRLPLYQYHPELAFIMDLPALREELHSIGLNIGLSFVADAILRPNEDFIKKHHKNNWDYSLDDYLKSCARLLPGYKTKFGPIAKDECLRFVADKNYNFRNEFTDRLQFLAMAGNLFSATLEHDDIIRCVVFFAVNSRNQLQYVNRGYYGKVKYKKMMFNLCVLSSFNFCRGNNLDCNTSQVMLCNFDDRFGWGFKDNLWNFNAENYPLFVALKNCYRQRIFRVETFSGFWAISWVLFGN